jgi:predicted component of type VI protein secretion system
MSELNPQPLPGQQVQVQIRDDKAKVVYSNVCRVGATPEEIFVDFAINLQNQETPGVAVMEVSTRVLMNFYSAKRLALALSQAVQQFESRFGTLELNPTRRLKQPGQ